MQTRRDHVQAHQFATNRLTSALVTGETGRGLAPFRRASLGAFAGMIIAALLCGGALVYGLIDPASAASAWRQQGSLVVDEQTGTRFIYLDGALHPTANYTSAMLLAGHDAAVHDVPDKALAGIPDGDTIGIQGAPQTLPSSLLAGAWAVCLSAPAPGGVALDLAPARHRTGSTAGQLILAAAPDGTQYVLWNNRKYQVAAKTALVAFGLGEQQPTPAPAGWLADVPSGAPLAPPVIRREGQVGPPVAGAPARIGSIFETTAAGTAQYFVELADGLAPLSRTHAALLLAAGQVGAVRQVSPAVIETTRASANRTLLGGLPDMLAGAAYRPGPAALCLLQKSPGRQPGTIITDPAAAGSGGVLVPAGTGMIVQPPQPRTGVAAEPSYLVTDTGSRYLLADPDAAPALGLGGV
ncbi:MAG TPA: type VII secretion protein EccB, partial [Streptosporangiaceae bacterium]